VLLYSGAGSASVQFHSAVDGSHEEEGGNKSAKTCKAPNT